MGRNLQGDIRRRAPWLLGADMDLKGQAQRPDPYLLLIVVHEVEMHSHENEGTGRLIGVMSGGTAPTVSTPEDILSEGQGGRYYA